MWEMRYVPSASTSKVTPMHKFIFYKTLFAISHALVTVTFICCF